jgi:hypothetical protein
MPPPVVFFGVEEKRETSEGEETPPLCGGEKEFDM